MAETSSFHESPKDAFKDRLSQRAQDTSRPALAHQSRGRALSAEEQALAEALMKIMGQGEQDFAAVAQGLSRLGLRAPISGRADWDIDLLQGELAALNAELDKAYARVGYGA
jgi:hypothetical protein